MTLDEIGLKFRTDKSSAYHDYLVSYEKIFGDPERFLSVLELGVADGCSLRMWMEYFPRALVVGVDLLRRDTNDVLMVIADATDPEKMDCVGKLFGPFDLVVDDASHVRSEQMTSMSLLLPFVKQGGFYVIEDIPKGSGFDGMTTVSGRDNGDTREDFAYLCKS